MRLLAVVVLVIFAAIVAILPAGYLSSSAYPYPRPDPYPRAGAFLPLVFGGEAPAPIPTAAASATPTATPTPVYNCQATYHETFALGGLGSRTLRYRIDAGRTLYVWLEVAGYDRTARLTIRDAYGSLLYNSGVVTASHARSLSASATAYYDFTVSNPSWLESKTVYWHSQSCVRN